MSAASAASPAAPSPPAAPAAGVQSLLPFIRTTKVSSVLNDSREYGKQHLFDGLAETCWNSAQGTPQFIQLAFTAPVTLTSLQVTFQGGFVGKTMTLAGTTLASPKKFLPIQTFEPRDDNQQQTFEVPQGAEVTNVKITFPTSTDFYGRITIYKLDVWGRVETPAAAEDAATSTAASPPA